MTLPASPDDAIEAVVEAFIARYPKRRVPLDLITRAATDVDRTAASNPDWRRRLRATIDRLVDAGLVTLPATKWDTTTTPPLPLYVIRPAVVSPAEDPTTVTVWHAALGWVPDIEHTRRLAPGERQLLAAVNKWLPYRTGETVPLRERSLQLLGDEKALERLRRTSSLFRDGHLTLNLLACEPCWPPVELTRLGNGPWLIIENWTTYATLRRAAQRDEWDGTLIWGSGTQVTTRLAALAEAGTIPTTITYFGDIDTAGLTLARQAHQAANDYVLGHVTPAAGLYSLLINIGTAQPDKRAPGAELIDWITTWLPAGTNDQVLAALTNKRRLVQEAVGWEQLKSLHLPTLLRS